MECPTCAGEVYDNRALNTKRASEGKKAMPEFACKDKDGCGWKKWGPRPQGGGFKPGPRPPQAPKWTWGQLSQMYERSLLLAAKHVGKILPKASPADVVAAGATIYISATRDGVKPDEAPVAPPKPDEADLYEPVGR